METTIEIGGVSLSLQSLEDVAEGSRKVRIGAAAREKIQKGRRTVEQLIERSDRPVYSINTGFGSLKNVRIPKEKLKELQVNIIRSHSAGVGDPLPKAVVRGMMLLRVHALASGHSGVRMDVVDLIVEMLNRDIVPTVPCQGSVGASGDLAPLAHIALAMIGEGTVEWNGERVPSKEALTKNSLKPLSPEAKEGLALLNGTQMMTALGGLVLLRGENALRHLDIAAAISLDALLGTPSAFDDRVHRLRPHPGQIDCAYNLHLLTAESEIFDSHRDCDRVQDAYSLRCAPQVHGAARDALTYVRSVLEREVNSVTDNPILFPGDDDPVASAGNFHGQPIAVALDTMSLALTGAASISERRIFRLLDPKLSELPAGLTSDAGLRSGLMMAQVTAAALVSECKTLAHPASVDSIPTWADQEDHVSMGAFGARKAEQIVDAFEKVVAIEILCAAQGLEFRRPLRSSKGVEAAVKVLRRAVPSLTEDRTLTPDFEAVVQLIRSRTLLKEVQNVVGELK